MNDIKDIRAESVILSSIIVHPDYVYLSDELNEHHFFEQENGYLYYAIKALATKNVTQIDAYNIRNILMTKTATAEWSKQISDERLSELIAIAPEVARNSAEEYDLLVKEVLEKAFRREMYGKLEYCKQLCVSSDSDNIRNEVYDLLDGTLIGYFLDDKIEFFGNKIDAMWAEIESRQEGTGGCGYPTAFPEVNKYFTYERGELVVVAAPGKAGKSFFMLTEIVDKLRSGAQCLYIDTEIPDRQHFERMLSHVSGVPVRLIKNGGMAYDDRIKIEEAKEWIRKQPYVHIYMPIPTREKVLTITKKLSAQGKLDFMVYDYIKSQGSNSSSELYNMLGDWTNTLKNDIAGELNIPILAAAQLNRSLGIADSYKIEQFSSVTANLVRKTNEEIVRDGGDECGNYKLFIKLNRLGEQMGEIAFEYVDLNFDGNRAIFTQAEKQHVVETPY